MGGKRKRDLKCMDCKGSGEVNDLRGIIDEQCPTCGGEGKVYSVNCPSKLSPNERCFNCGRKRHLKKKAR